MSGNESTYSAAFQGHGDMGKFRVHIEASGRELEKQLYALCPAGNYNFQCSVCEKELKGMAGDHIYSQKHFKALQQKMTWSYPPWEIAKGLDTSRPWVDSYRVETRPGTMYCFNHLTGEQGQVQADGSVIATVAAPAPAVAAPAPATYSAAPALTPAVAPSATPWGSFTPGVASSPAAGPSWQEAFKDWGNKKGDWRRFMEPKGRDLDAVVEKRCPSTAWSMKCPICDKNMTRGVGDHMPSRDHAARLQEKLNWNVPPEEIAAQWERPWVFRIPSERQQGSFILFNMVTGETKIEEATSSSTSTEKYTHAQPPQQVHQAAAADSAEDDLPTWAKPEPQPAAVQQVVPQAAYPQVAAAPPQAIAPCPSGPPYQQAVEDWGNKKGSWRQYFEPRALAFEELLGRHSAQTWDLKCPVCDAAMTRGVSDHIPSRNHAKQLQEKLNWNMPPEAVAGDWGRPWIMKVPLPFGQGSAEFNMLTGDSRVAGASGNGPAIQPQQPAQAVPVAPIAAPQTVTQMQPAVPPQGTAGPSWSEAAQDWKNKTGKWRAHMEPKAVMLEALIYKHCPAAGYSLSCNICNSPLRTDHLPGKAHCTKLQEKLDWKIPPEDVARQQNRPWVWRIPCEIPAGGFIFFNHLTGEMGLDSGAGPVLQEAARPVAPPTAATAPAPSFYPATGVCPTCPTCPPQASEPEVDYGTAFQDWGNKKGLYRKFYEPKAIQLQNMIAKHGCPYPTRCEICDMNMQSLENHLPSTAHSKKFQEKMGWKMPPPEIAAETGRPWFLKFPCAIPAGAMLLYNLITGETSLQQGGPAAPVTPQASVPAPAPAAPPAQTPAPAPAAAQPQPEDDELPAWAAGAGTVPPQPAQTLPTVQPQPAVPEAATSPEVSSGKLPQEPGSPLLREVAVEQAEPAASVAPAAPPAQEADAGGSLPRPVSQPTAFGPEAKDDGSDLPVWAAPQAPAAAPEPIEPQAATACPPVVGPPPGLEQDDGDELPGWAGGGATAQAASAPAAETPTVTVEPQAPTAQPQAPAAAAVEDDGNDLPSWAAPATSPPAAAETAAAEPPPPAATAQAAEEDDDLPVWAAPAKPASPAAESPAPAQEQQTAPAEASKAPAQSAADEDDEDELPSWSQAPAPATASAMEVAV